MIRIARGRWSSDVCSSDLILLAEALQMGQAGAIMYLVERGKEVRQPRAAVACYGNRHDSDRQRPLEFRRVLFRSHTFGRGSPDGPGGRDYVPGRAWKRSSTTPSRCRLLRE